MADVARHRVVAVVVSHRGRIIDVKHLARRPARRGRVGVVAAVGLLLACAGVGLGHPVVAAVIVATVVIALIVTFGDRSEPGRFRIGEAEGSDLLAASPTAGLPFDLVECRDRGVVVRLSPGMEGQMWRRRACSPLDTPRASERHAATSTELPMGGRCRLRWGEFAFAVDDTPSEAIAPPSLAFDRPAWASLGLSVVVVGGLLALAGSGPAPQGSDAERPIEARFAAAVAEAGPPALPRFATPPVVGRLVDPNEAARIAGIGYGLGSTTDAWAQMSGLEVGEAFGATGLGLVGTGRAGCGLGSAASDRASAKVVGLSVARRALKRRPITRTLNAIGARSCGFLAHDWASVSFTLHFVVDADGHARSANAVGDAEHSAAYRCLSQHVERHRFARPSDGRDTNVVVRIAGVG